MPLESSIVNSIRKTIAPGWWSLKIHGGPYSTAGVPDLLCIRDGRAVFLEVKQPGKHPTQLQLAIMETIKKQAGAPCFVVRSAAEAVECLSRILP